MSDPKMSSIPEDIETPKPVVHHKSFHIRVWTYRNYILSIFTPLIFLPILIFYSSMSSRCAYAILVMSVYWMTEAVPMAITALLPVIFMPWFGIMDSRDVCAHYLKDANMLFFGGLMIAIAVEKWNLHKRIALRTLMLVGSKPLWIMFGFMNVTAFLSMWLSNTATTAMMVPIAHAILRELGQHLKCVQQERAAALSKARKEAAAIEDRRIELAIKQNEERMEIIDQGCIMLVVPSSEKTMIEMNEGLALPLQSSVDNEASVTFDDVLTDLPMSSSKLLDVPMIGFPKNESSSASLDGMPKNDSSLLLLSENQSKRKRYVSAGGNSIKLVRATDNDPNHAEDELFKNFSVALKLSIAYAANIGGTATLTGTGPNIVLKGQADSLYGGDAGINFSSWFVLALPNMIISLVLAWIWLLVLFLGPRAAFNPGKMMGKDAYESASAVVKQEYKKLGNMSFPEAAVMIHFIVLALLWLTKEPEFIAGWGSLMPNKYVTDASVAITVSAILFLLPSNLNELFCCSEKQRSIDHIPGQPAPPLLDWCTVNKQMPWGVILLLGGGFALADACKVSGLSEEIGNLLGSFSHLPGWAIVIVLCLFTVFLTGFTSNVATATIFMPILAELAEHVNINPLYLMIPVTISASFAFILPVSTPPNAIVYAYGDIRIWDMLKAGFPMSIICILVLQLAINTWGYSYFHLDEFPAWASISKSRNSTGLDLGNLILMNVTMGNYTI